MRPTRPPTYSSYDRHGMSRTPEYRVWVGMKSRCYSPQTKGYCRYGAKGIRVCQRWHRFINFYEDMGPRPSSNHDLSRKDHDKNYGPDNCEWKLHSENMKELRTRDVKNN